MEKIAFWSFLVKKESDIDPVSLWSDFDSKWIQQLGTEAVKGSSGSQTPSPKPGISTTLSITYANPPDNSDMMILNMSDKPSLEEQADEKEEEEKGEEGDHAN